MRKKTDSLVKCHQCCSSNTRQVCKIGGYRPVYISLVIAPAELAARCAEQDCYQLCKPSATGVIDNG